MFVFVFITCILFVIIDWSVYVHCLSVHHVQLFFQLFITWLGSVVLCSLIACSLLGLGQWHLQLGQLTSPDINKQRERGNPN